MFAGPTSVTNFMSYVSRLPFSLIFVNPLSCASCMRTCFGPIDVFSLMKIRCVECLLVSKQALRGTKIALVVGKLASAQGEDCVSHLPHIVGIEDLCLEFKEHY